MNTAVVVSEALATSTKAAFKGKQASSQAPRSSGGLIRSVALMALMSCSAAHATPEGAGWGDYHNSLHFAGELMAGAVASAVIEDKWTAFGVAMIPGIAREEWKRHHGYASYSAPRLFFNTAGAALGVVLTKKLIISTRGVQYSTVF